MDLSNLKEWIENDGMEEQIKRYNVPKNEQHAQRWGTLFDYLMENNLSSMLEHAGDIVEKYESGQDVLSFLDGIEKGRAVAEKEGPSLGDIIQGTKENTTSHEKAQDNIHQVFMVIENNQGLCEHNFLVTESWIVENGLMSPNQSLDEMRQELRNDWQGGFYSRADISYLIKTCESPDELRDFVRGAFNDDPPLQNSDWYCDFQPERCTSQALEVLEKTGFALNEISGMENRQKEVKQPLEDLIKEAREKTARHAPSGHIDQARPLDHFINDAKNSAAAKNAEKPEVPSKGKPGLDW